MARFLAIDWDQQQLHVVAGGAGRGGMRAEQALSWTLPEALTAATGEALGKGLREALKAAGVAPAPVLACVGRERVVLKDLHYPPVPASEEPALVRFQAANELSEPTDEVIIDYTHLGDPQAPGERQALAVIVRKEVVQAVQALCRGLGMKLLAVTPRPAAVYGALERCRRADFPTGWVEALLTVGSRWADLGILRGQTLLFARSLAVGPNLAGDVKRTLTVFAAGAETPVQELHVATQGDPAALCAGLRDLLALPVHPLDPFLSDEDNIRLDPAYRGSYTAPVGLLHRWALSAELAINFIAPKEPRPAQKPRQRQAALAGIACALVVLFLIVAGNRVLASKKATKLQLEDDKIELENKLKILAQEKADIEGLHDWNHAAVSWLDELYDLTARFPSLKGFRLDDLKVDPSPKKTKDRIVATMSLTGEGPPEAATLVHLLVNDMNKDPHLRAFTSSDTAKGILKFKLKIEIVSPPVAKYDTVLKVPAKTPAPPPPDADDPDREGGNP